MAWTENTVKSWSKLKKRTTKQENNLIANISKAGKVTWYFQRTRPLSDKRLGTHPEVSLREAKKLVTEEKSRKFLGTNPDSKLTFEQYITTERFLNQKNKERVSNADSMRTLYNLVCPVIGHLKMEDITLKHLDDFKFGYDAQASTVNRILNEIRAVLTHAVENGVIENNIKIKNLPVRTAKKERRYLTKAELNALREEARMTVDARGKKLKLDELPKNQYLMRGHIPLICDIAIYCGMRLGEILQLRYSDITTYDETTEESWQFKLRAETTKAGKERNVYLPKFLKNRLEEWWYDNLTTEELDEVLKSKRTPRAILDKELFPYTTIQSAWENLHSRAELPDDISFHSLRHHFCSNALLNDVPLQSVKEAAGHSSITTTEQYLHALPHKSSERFLVYWNSIDRPEDKPSPKKETLKPVMVIQEGATPKLGEQGKVMDADFRFNLDEWLANQTSAGITIDTRKLEAGDPDAVKFNN